MTNVTETADDIRITAESLDWPIPGVRAGSLALLGLDVSLADGVGSRVVRDGNGTPALISVVDQSAFEHAAHHSGSTAAGQVGLGCHARLASC